MERNDCLTASVSPSWIGPPADDPSLRCPDHAPAQVELRGAKCSLALVDAALERFELCRGDVRLQLGRLGLNHRGVGAAQGLTALLQPDAGLFELQVRWRAPGARWRRSRCAATRAWPTPRDKLPRGCPAPAPARRPRPPAARTARSTASHFPRARPVQGPVLVARRAIPAPSGGSARASGPRPPPPAPPARPRPARARTVQKSAPILANQPHVHGRCAHLGLCVLAGPPAADRPRAETGPDRAAPAGPRRRRSCCRLRTTQRPGRRFQKKRG